MAASFTHAGRPPKAAVVEARRWAVELAFERFGAAALNSDEDAHPGRAARVVADAPATSGTLSNGSAAVRTGRWGMG